MKKLEVPHALVGGAALPAWGRIRATEDIDFLISLQASEQEKLDALTASLREAGFAHLKREDRKRLGNLWIYYFWYPVRPQGYALRLDLLMADSPEYREILERAVSREIDNYPVSVASCEDLILLKLAAGQPVDLADARELIDINRTSLDRIYLQNQSAKMRLQEALHRIWAELS